MKNRILLLFVLLNVWFATAQTVDQIKSYNQSYIWGEGLGNTLSSATLDNTNRFIIQHEPDSKVSRHIKKRSS